MHAPRRLVANTSTQANWGDTIQVTVHNDITGPEEGSALHWHGILQKTSQWMDGVPSGEYRCRGRGS